MRLLIDISNYNMEWIRNAYDIPHDIGTDIAKAIIDGYECKTGHWKMQTIKGNMLTYCSECGFGKHINETRRYSYCPNCGARMEEPEDIPMEYFESGGR